MSIEQTFLQWYTQLFPEDQINLCSFLKNWLNPESTSNIPTAYVIPQIPVVQSFLQGYAQLSPNDQQVLCNFLRNWLNPPQVRQTNLLHFSGKFVTPVRAKMANNAQKVKCPHCYREFDLNH